MNRIASLIVGTAAATGLVVAPLTVAAPAQADTPKCVSKPEFSKVKKGWAISRVQKVFDISGKQTYYMGASPYYPASQSRDYNACSQYGTVSIDYEKKSGVWKVTQKYAFWG